MKKFTVYKHTTPSGKSYIGITGRIVEKRWDSGHGYRQNKYFWNAIKKYGWNNIAHEILYEDITKEEACKIEIDLINLFKTSNRRFGYNFSTGGEYGSLGVKLSKDTRLKMSLAKSGSNHPMYGKGHSEETKEKLSIIMSGDKHPQYGTKGSENKIKKLSKANSGKNHPMYGTVHDKSHRQRIKESVTKAKGVKVICLETEKTYLSAASAARASGANPSHILSCCKGQRKSAGNYHWKYANDKGGSS